MKRPLLLMMARGWQRRCPVCARGALFRRWTALSEACPHCGTLYARREGDIYFMLYGTMAMITGIYLVLAVLLLLNQPFYQRFKPIVWGVLGIGLFASILATARQRKGMAVAVDCYVEGKRPREPHV